MPGEWLSRLGRRLFHADTFALMVSPAIADLQFEHPNGIARPRHYYALLRAFTGALWFDISGDLITLSNDLVPICVLTAVQGSYYTFMLLLLSGLGAGRLSALELDSGVITRAFYYLFAIAVAGVMTSSACFWPPRRTADAEPAE
jgi:hypothetical protein